MLPEPMITIMTAVLVAAAAAATGRIVEAIIIRKWPLSPPPDNKTDQPDTTEMPMPEERRKSKRPKTARNGRALRRSATDADKTHP
jgi:hypothetical protein